MALADKDPEIYKNYLKTYPEGKYKSQVKTTLENLMLNKANREFESEEYNLAKNSYQEFREVFPSSNSNNIVTERLDTIEKRLQQKTQVENRTSGNYIMFTYGGNETYGLQFGKLHLSKVGTYFNIRANESVTELKFTEDIEVQNSRGDFEEAVIAASFGLTFKIYYPLWIYAGVGVQYKELFIKDDSDEVMTFKITDEEPYIIFPEVGLKVKLGRIGALKVGGAYLDGEAIFQVGLGFMIRNW